MRDLSWAERQWREAANVLALAPALLIGCASCHEPTGTTTQVHERWYREQVGWAKTRPGVLGDAVFFGTGDGNIIARKKATGEPIWTSKIANEMISGANMVTRDGFIVVPVVHETVALDAATGHELWRYSAPADTTGNGPAVRLSRHTSRRTETPSTSPLGGRRLARLTCARAPFVGSGERAR